MTVPHAGIESESRDVSIMMDRQKPCFDGSRQMAVTGLRHDGRFPENALL